MFLGTISSASAGGSCWRRQRLRSAIASGALGGALADDVLVELGDDLPGGELLERGRPLAGGDEAAHSSSTVNRSLV